MRRLPILFGAAVFAVVLAGTASAQLDIRGEIKGRVTTDDGRPARRVSIMVMDLTTLDRRDVITNDFGYFRVRDLQFGNTFVVGAKSKNYFFTFPFQNVTLDLISREVVFTASRFESTVPVSAIDEPVVILSKEP